MPYRVGQSRMAYLRPKEKTRTYGQRRLEIDASESTICSFSGQEILLGSDSGRLAM